MGVQQGLSALIMIAHNCGTRETVGNRSQVIVVRWRRVVYVACASGDGT